MSWCNTGNGPSSTHVQTIFSQFFSLNVHVCSFQVWWSEIYWWNKSVTLQTAWDAHGNAYRSSQKVSIITVQFCYSNLLTCSNCVNRFKCNFPTSNVICLEVLDLLMQQTDMAKLNKCCLFSTLPVNGHNFTVLK